jgi:hypothetical protein
MELGSSRSRPSWLTPHRSHGSFCCMLSCSCAMCCCVLLLSCRYQNRCAFLHDWRIGAKPDKALADKPWGFCPPIVLCVPTTACPTNPEAQVQVAEEYTPDTEEGRREWAALCGGIAACGLISLSTVKDVSDSVDDPVLFSSFSSEDCTDALLASLPRRAPGRLPFFQQLCN